MLTTLMAFGHARGAGEPSALPAELDLFGGSMASSLIEIGQRYGVIVSFKPSLVERLVTPAVRGRYTLAQALNQVLRDSDLTADIAPEGVVTLRRAATAPTAAARQPGPEAADDDESPIPDAAAAPQGNVYVMETVVVNGRSMRSNAKQDAGLRASSSESAALTDTPLMRLPQAVSVMTRDMLELTQAHTQIDAMGYVTGVSLQAGPTPLTGVPGKVRAFPAEYSISGIPSLRSAFAVDAALIERIEVLKGPSGVVGGIADYGGRGGLVNVIRKRPRPVRQSEGTLSAGSQDGGTLRATFDIGAGGDDTPWRLVGYGTRSGRTDGGYAARYSNGLLGAISQHGESFSATLTFERDRRRETPPPMARAAWVRDTDFGIANGQESPASKEDGTHLVFGDTELDVEWQLSRNWRLRGTGRWEDGSIEVLRRSTHRTKSFSRFRERSGRWRLVGDIETGPVGHRIVFGGDVQRRRLTGGMSYVLSDLIAPGDGALPETAPDGDAFIPVAEWRDRYTERGVFWQDQLSIGALRMRFAMRRSVSAEVLFGEVREGELRGTNWDVGAAYQVMPALIAYAGAQAALEANPIARTPMFNEAIAPAAQSRQVQAGMKLDLPDDRLAITLEAYRMRQRYAVNFDSSLGGSQGYLLPGISSRGLELEALGRIGPALELCFGLNVMHALEPQSVTFDANTYNAPASAVPARSMHLLGRYRLPPELARDTTIAMALRARSSSWAVPPYADRIQPSLRIPGGAGLDVSWTRQFGNGSFGVSVLNVFDRRLYGHTAGIDFVPLQPGRSLNVMLAFKG